jgi:phosphomannomutase/phosphoglucomutase
VEKNLETLIEKVKKNQADLGIAFDGDGDRVGVVDELGNFHDANQLLILLAQDISTRNKTSVIYTVSCSSTIEEEVEKVGGKAIMVPVGHSYVETAMREHNALLGGEQSGHFFIAENYYPFDDACFTAANIIRIASNSENPFSEIFKKMPRTYQTAEIRPDCPDNIKFELIDKITAQLSKEYTCNTMDGVRIEFPNGGWASIRASNTSPKLSICTEARSPIELEKIDELIWHVLKEHNIMHP